MSDRSNNTQAAPGVAPDGWWGGPGGGREVLGVAAPLVVSSLSWTVMTFADRMILNHWSGAAMSAAFVAGVIWWAVVAMPVGLCAYTNTFVAQYHGAGRPERIGPAVWQGVVIALCASPLVLAPIPWSEAMFRWAGHDPEAVALESQYFGVLCLAGPAMLFAQSLSAFYSGRSKTVVVMIVDAAGAVLNLLLDWWWVFGLTLSFGNADVRVFPAWGIAGAAWATVVSMWAKAVVYALLVLRKSNRERFGTGQMRWEAPLLRRMLRFGLPSGFQMLIDVAGFTVFVLLVARLGAVENEATSMTFSVGSLAFMPVCGLGLAASILVGQYLGEDRDKVAARATWATLYVAWAYMAVVSVAMVLAPGVFLAGFVAAEPVAGDAARRAAVTATAATLMRFVAAYNFLDAMAIVFGSALKGAGDTRFVLAVSLGMAVVLGLATWLAVDFYNAGLYGCWGVVSLWIAGLGVILLARFLGGRWRSMRVVEAPPEGPQDGN